MKKITLILSILILLIAANNCTCPDGPAGPAGKDGASDKQICIPFLGFGSGLMPCTNDTTGRILYSQPIIKFNKSNYIGVDSVIFVAFIWCYGDNNMCLADVYNLTDSTVIINSLVSTNKEEGEFAESGNIFNNLPNKEINLAIRIRCLKQDDPGEDNYYAFIQYGYLFLYRR